MNKLSFTLMKLLLCFITLIPLFSLVLGFGFNLVRSGLPGLVLYVVIALALFIITINVLWYIFKWKEKDTSNEKDSDCCGSPGSSSNCKCV